jgi:cytochrome c oxidase cbb3-type subunit III
MNPTSTSKHPFLPNDQAGSLTQDATAPRWWKRTYWATLLFAPLYMAYYHVGAPGRSPTERYQLASSENMRKQYAEIGNLDDNQATLLEYMEKPQWMKVGESVFRANCVSCHASDGGGGVGPNLCDENFKNIKEPADILKVVKNGVAGGAMPAWGSRLGHPNDVILVSAYVATLRGSKPKAPKSPDGTIIPPWPKFEPPKASSP